MNSKTVLQKIMAALSSEETTKVVELVQATLPDGTTLESPSFDVGEEVFVISGEEKLPAPDGEHTLVLTDEDGREVSFAIEVENGIIVEREPVEDQDMEEETKPVEEIPETMSAEDEEADKLTEEVLEELEEESDEEEVEMEEEEIEDEEDEVVIDMEEVQKVMEDMSYRIEELEKKVEDMMKPKEDEEEVELSKLDGAPSTKKTINKNQKKNASPQSLFLKKLYNN